MCLNVVFYTFLMHGFVETLGYIHLHSSTSLWKFGYYFFKYFLCSPPSFDDTSYTYNRMLEVILHIMDTLHFQKKYLLCFILTISIVRFLSWLIFCILESDINSMHCIFHLHYESIIVFISGSLSQVFFCISCLQLFELTG